ncbi:hypothetical protein swp_4532 [Shewanella piezotolerans WP3]|uniref:Uncharacterized protein n=1 Tax=Shewanella piezotolerans (strain WP3 / JCM 13877) TaxID=225849 RepID=B8CUI3_SHEPW|nr:hypothetical protein [Shewanella piezotolerans]ACJ31175.1 hypothetical protein swp_4532 [Shewanella piezotolerans WP3]
MAKLGSYNKRFNLKQPVLLPELPLLKKRKSKLANFLSVAAPAAMLSFILINDANAAPVCGTADFECKAAYAAEVERKLDERLALYNKQQQLQLEKEQVQREHMKQAHNLCFEDPLTPKDERDCKR